MPITLYGEGDYALTDIKSIRVTEDFTGLGETTTNCQTEEFRADCLARRYLTKVVETCHCAPFSLSRHYPAQVPQISDIRYPYLSPKPSSVSINGGKEMAPIKDSFSHKPL